MRWLLLFIALCVLVVALRRARDRAAGRGRVYPRGGAPTRGNVVGGLGFEQVFEPEYEHVYEEQQAVAVEAEQDAVGEGEDR